MALCVIVGAGDFSPADLPPKAPGDLWIAADGGYAHLKRAGFEPDLFLGDLDSLPQAPQGIPSRLLPVKKDDTDTVYAARLGLERGYRDFLILGGLGGERLSHTVANFQLLGFLAGQGAVGELRHGSVRVFLLNAGEERRFSQASGFFSLFAAGDRALVTMTGCKFPGERLALTSTFPLGVSNEFQGDARVSVEQGAAYLVLD